jgi:hypothetical protein
MGVDYVLTRLVRGDGVDHAQLDRPLASMKHITTRLREHTDVPRRAARLHAMYPDDSYVQQKTAKPDAGIAIDRSTSSTT